MDEMAELNLYTVLNDLTAEAQKLQVENANKNKK